MPSSPSQAYWSCSIPTRVHRLATRHRVGERRFRFKQYYTPKDCKIRQSQRGSVNYIYKQRWLFRYMHRCKHLDACELSHSLTMITGFSCRTQWEHNSEQPSRERQDNSHNWKTNTSLSQTVLQLACKSIGIWVTHLIYPDHRTPTQGVIYSIDAAISMHILRPVTSK